MTAFDPNNAVMYQPPSMWPLMPSRMPPGNLAMQNVAGYGLSATATQIQMSQQNREEQRNYLARMAQALKNTMGKP